MAEEVWHKVWEKSRLDRHHLYKVILKIVVDFEMSAQPASVFMVTPKKETQK